MGRMSKYRGKGESQMSSGGSAPVNPSQSSPGLKTGYIPGGNWGGAGASVKGQRFTGKGGHTSHSMPKKGKRSMSY